MCAMDSQQAGKSFFMCVRVCVNGNEKSLSLIWNGKKVDSQREKATLRWKKNVDRLKLMKTQA